MFIYNYDRDTFMYTGISKAEKDQMGSGYLLPAFSVDFPPPEYGEFERPFFIKGEWIIKRYYRGKKQIELSTKIISNIDYIGNIKEGFQYISDNEALECMQNPLRFEVRDNMLYRLNDEEYNLLLQKNQDKQRIAEIKQQLDILDIKTIRAERENTEKESGLTWMQYYLNEIEKLKNELLVLQNKLYE